MIQSLRNSVQSFTQRLCWTLLKKIGAPIGIKNKRLLILGFHCGSLLSLILTLEVCPVWMWAMYLTFWRNSFSPSSGRSHVTTLLTWTLKMEASCRSKTSATMPKSSWCKSSGVETTIRNTQCAYSLNYVLKLGNCGTDFEWYFQYFIVPQWFGLIFSYLLQECSFAKSSSVV
jgi:hypothetical protein